VLARERALGGCPDSVSACAGITKPSERGSVWARARTGGQVTREGSRSRPAGDSTACLRTRALGLRLDVVTVSRLFTGLDGTPTIVGANWIRRRQHGHGRTPGAVDP